MTDGSRERSAETARRIASKLEKEFGYETVLIEVVAI